MAEVFYHYAFSNPPGGTVHRSDCWCCHDGRGQHKRWSSKEGELSVGWRKLVGLTEESVAEYALRSKTRLCGHCFK